MNSRNLSAVALILAAAPLHAQTLKDPGFETPGQTLVSTSDAPNGKAQIGGTIAEGWSDNTNWADVGLKYALDTTNPHSGRSDQQIEITHGFAQFAQSVQLARGYYRAGIWLRAAAPQWVSVSIRQSGAPYTTYASGVAWVSTQWTHVEADGPVPEDVAALFLVNSSGPGTVYLDDAELAPSAPQPITLSPPTTAIPRTYFGLNINHMHSEGIIPWPAIPFGGYRTWDSGVIWASIEPKKDEYDWSRLDKDVAEAQQRGVQILLTLGFTPTWASSDPTNKTSPYGALGATAPPADINDWKNFIRTVATRYKGRIQGYEIWNEPDVAGFYTGTPAQLVPLEQAAHEVLRQADPAALVVTPAPSSGGTEKSLKWMDDYLAAGGGRNADVMAVHMYTATPEDNVVASSSYRALLARYGMDKKPLWNTETGWGFDNKGTDAEISSDVARAYVLNWALHFSRYYWYSWSQNSLVGIRPDAQGRFTVLTPGAQSYAQVEAWLVGVRMLSCGRDAHGVWTCALRGSDGSRQWIVWSPSGTQELAVPREWKVKQVQSLAGQITTLGKQATVTVGVAPVLLSATTGRR